MTLNPSVFVQYRIYVSHLKLEFQKCTYDTRRPMLLAGGMWSRLFHYTIPTPRRLRTQIILSWRMCNVKRMVLVWVFYVRHAVDHAPLHQLSGHRIDQGIEQLSSVFLLIVVHMTYTPKFWTVNVPLNHSYDAIAWPKSRKCWLRADIFEVVLKRLVRMVLTLWIKRSQSWCR